MLKACWAVRNYIVRVAYTIVKFGWLALLSICVGYFYGFGSNESILMLLPLQAILIADFGLSVIASVEKKRPGNLVCLFLSFLATCSTMLIYLRNIEAIFNAAECIALFSLIFLFAYSAILINCVDSILRSNGYIVPVSMTIISFIGVFELLVSSLMFLDFKVFYCSVYVVFILFSLVHARKYIFREKYNIELAQIPKFLFFSNGVLLVYFGTRYDLSWLKGDELILLDLAEKSYAILMFPLNVLLNLLHSKGIDLRVGWFYLLAGLAFLMIGMLHLLGYNQIAVFAGIYLFKLFFSIYSYYGNYIDRVALIGVLLGFMYLVLCVLAKVIWVPVELYLEVTLAMIVGVFVILVASNFIKKYTVTIRRI